MDEKVQSKLQKTAAKVGKPLLAPYKGVDPYSERIYTSVVDEWRRVMRIRRLLHTTSKNRSVVWAALLASLADLYNTEVETFAFEGKTLRIAGVLFEVKELEANRELAIRTKEARVNPKRESAAQFAQNGKSPLKTIPQNTAYTLRFALRQNWLTRRVNVLYSDTAVSPRVLFGLKDEFTKFIYRRNARYNARQINKKLHYYLKMQNSKDKESNETQ